MSAGGGTLALAGLVWCASGVAAGATNHRSVFGGDGTLGWPGDLDQSLLPGMLAVATGFVLAVIGSRRPG